MYQVKEIEAEGMERSKEGNKEHFGLPFIFDFCVFLFFGERITTAANRLRLGVVKTKAATHEIFGIFYS